MATGQELFLNIAGRFVDSLTAMRKLRWDFALEKTRQTAAVRAQGKEFDFRERMSKELQQQRFAEQKRVGEQRLTEQRQTLKLREASNARSGIAQVAFGIETELGQGFGSEKALEEFDRVYQETENITLANKAAAEAINIDPERLKQMRQSRFNQARPEATISVEMAISQSEGQPQMEDELAYYRTLSPGTRIDRKAHSAALDVAKVNIRDIGSDRRQIRGAVYKTYPPGTDITVIAADHVAKLTLQIQGGQKNILGYKFGKQAYVQGLEERKLILNQMSLQLARETKGTPEYEEIKGALEDEVSEVETYLKKLGLVNDPRESNAPQAPKTMGVISAPKTQEEARTFFLQPGNGGVAAYNEWLNTQGNK